METEFQSTETERFYEALASVPADSGWVLERSLGMAPSSGSPLPWFPLASGYGSYVAPRYRGVVYFAQRQDPWDTLRVRLQQFPVLPVPPHPASIGQGPRPSYKFFHAGMRFRPSDGLVVAVWQDRANPSGPPRVAHFAPTEVDFSDPAPLQSTRWPFAVGCLTGSPSEATPIYMGYSIFPLVDGETVPAATPGLTGDDAAFRQFIVTRQADLRQDMWPPQNTAPYVPPSPATLDQRSFFRLRTGGPLAVDLNHNQIPDVIGDYYSAPNQIYPGLILSEACFFRTAANASELIGGEAADWVEIWNPTSSALSTEDYYLGNTSAGPGFPLPLLTLEPGEYLLIHCTAEGRARLPAGDPLLARTAGFDLKERGDKIYLKRRILVNGSLASFNASVLDPPPGDLAFPDGRAIANISYGIQAQGPGVSPAVRYGYFEHPTPGALNLGILLGRVSGFATASVSCAVPVVEDATSPLAAPVPLRGQLFPTGSGLGAVTSFSARLRSPDPDATIVYTLNGADPTGQSAVYHPAQPILISGTTILRARALRPGLLPSATVTRTFIHTPSVPSQIEPGTANTPLNDPVVSTENVASAPSLSDYGTAGGIVSQLSARPSVLITDPRKISSAPLAPLDEFTTDGRVVSVEYCDPSLPAAYCQENAYQRISGNHSDGNASSKDSWHLLFKKAISLKGSGSWQTPTIVVSGAATSAIFPGSKVAAFDRLMLRNPGSDSYFDILGGSSSDSIYLRDVWLKETQRALGGLTAKRRWVHVHVNGLYWGVYDLEEHHDPSMISNHLLATNPPQPASSFAPANILFLNYDQPNPVTFQYGADPVAQASWDTMVEAASVARQAPADQALYNAVAAQLDIPDYINYILTLSLTGKDDQRPDQFRGWRHPVDHRWHLIAWDGDATKFSDFNGNGAYLNNGDFVNHYTPSPPGGTPAYINPDQRPHEHLKFHPTYRSTFTAQLQALLKSSSANPGPNVLLAQQIILERFDFHATDFRQTLECEVMRWGRNASLNRSWETEVNYHRFLLDDQNQPAADILMARRFIKEKARESRLLNDIPPPVITVSGNRATITRPAGGTGVIYARVGFSEQDPADYDFPEFIPGSVSSVPKNLGNEGNTVSARIYGPDLDGEYHWSALAVFPSKQ